MTGNINIEGRDLYFEVTYSDESYDYTNFYEGTETYTYKKWGLFGETITEERPKLVFTIDRAMSDYELTKEWWRQELTREIRLLERREQIERGEFI